jgi:hypothetical protein
MPSEKTAPQEEAKDYSEDDDVTEFPGERI